MKRSTLILSHIAALLAGIALALMPAASDEGRGQAISYSSGATKQDSHLQPDLHPESEAKRATGGSRSDQFRKAWRQLRAGDQTVEERLKKQRELLEEWAQVDLAAALDAAMAEAWDDDLNGSNEHPLLGAFQKAFWNDPLGAWKLIQSGRYDPGAQIILREWINSVAYSDPVLVVSMLGEIPRGLLREALPSALVGAGQKPGSLDQIIEKLTSLPASQENYHWLMMACKSMPTGGDSDALREKWTAMPPGREKTAAQFAWAASLREADRATMDAQWAALPEKARQQALNSLFAQLYPDSRALIPALDLAMEKGEWGVVATIGAGKLDQHEMDPMAKAQWAMKLPERAETQRIFDGAVAGLLREDPEAAKGWISDMDAGDWRKERALLEFSRLALDPNHSMENFQWAYAQITDPAAKKAAEGILQRQGQELEWTDPDE